MKAKRISQETVELDVEYGDGGTVEAEGVCSTCASKAKSGELVGARVVTSPTGKPHYTELDSTTTLCGRDASAWGP